MRLQPAMNLRKSVTIAALAALFFLPDILLPWGFWAHQEITRKAAQLMPAETHGFFQRWADSLSAHSIDPDLWRRFDPAESNRHFIDLDLLEPFPFSGIPEDYNAAVDKFGAEKMQQAGIVPWRAESLLDSLSAALRSRAPAAILRYASALAHYVEDIHMPLHTVLNYDGQLSGNKGIHGRYERWMVEAHKQEFLQGMQPARPVVLDAPRQAIFSWLKDSYVWADNLLRADELARDPAKTYEKPEDFDAAYYQRLQDLTRVMTEQQTSHAAFAVASCWLTAWERAGRPNLDGISLQIEKR